MAALHASLRIPNGVGVVVILGYRRLSFWLPTFAGWAAAAYLRRTKPGPDLAESDSAPRSKTRQVVPSQSV